MSERIHDDEPDTSEPVLKALIRAEYAQLTGSPIEYLTTSGTDNAMWRVRTDQGPDFVVRLPRHPEAAAGVRQEVAVLQQLDGTLANTGVVTPTVVHFGQPHDVFPHHWSILEWIDGTDAWTARDRLAALDLDSLALDLARSATAIGQLSTDVVHRRRPGSRGGPLGPLVERLHRWLEDPVWNAATLVDVDRVRRLSAEALELADDPIEQWLRARRPNPGKPAGTAGPAPSHHRLGRSRHGRYRTGPRSGLGCPGALGTTQVQRGHGRR